MSCLVLNSGFYFHLSFVVHLPVLHLLIAAQTGKVVRKKKKKKAFLSHTQLTKRNMPCKTWSLFSSCHLHIPPGKKKKMEAEEKKNNIESTEKILQSLSLMKVMEEHSRIGLKFRGMFSYMHLLHQTVEIMHKHILGKLFRLLAEIICTLERGKRYLYLHEHNYWINPSSLAKIKDSLSLSPHSLDWEEISVRKTTHTFRTTEDKNYKMEFSVNWTVDVIYKSFHTCLYKTTDICYSSTGVHLAFNVKGKILNKVT